MTISAALAPAAKPSLGRLEPVDLRSVWESESRDFTPWLAQAENIALLGEAIHLELEVDGTEKHRADILCKDTATGHLVLTENQLGPTDHVHLGQLLTYAAGLEAATIVWVARRITDEHRAALDWLNAITDARFNHSSISSAKKLNRASVMAFSQSSAARCSSVKRRATQTIVAASSPAA